MSINPTIETDLVGEYVSVLQMTRFHYAEPERAHEVARGRVRAIHTAQTLHGGPGIALWIEVIDPSVVGIRGDSTHETSRRESPIECGDVFVTIVSDAHIIRILKKQT